MCFKAGNCGDRGNPCCLCIEATCCPGLAVSSTRQFVMDKYAIQPDPCDHKIMACSNCLQMLACLFHILAIFEPSCRDAAAILDCIADLVFLTVMGCMNAQVDLELKTRGGSVGPGAPPRAEGVAALEMKEREEEEPEDLPGAATAAVAPEATY